MNRYIQMVCAPGLLLLGAGLAHAGSFQEVGGLVVMEAENATSAQEYKLEEQAMASGGKGMRVAAAAKSGGGALSFDFTVTTGGLYLVYIRTLCDDHLNNGMWLKLDAKQVVAPPTDKYAGVKDIYLSRPGWHWRPRWQGPGQGNHGGQVSIEVTPGKHTLTINKRMVETPFIDKVVLMRPDLPGPQDLGPPETPLGGAPMMAFDRDAGAPVDASDASSAGTDGGDGALPSTPPRPPAQADAAPEPETAAPERSSGEGCTLAGSDRAAAKTWWLLAAAVLALGRRRR